MKKALITGITGQDGSYLAEFLLEKGYEVHGIKRRTSLINTSRIDHLYHNIKDKDNKFFLHHGDMTDSVSLVKIISAVKPNEIYNLAAQSHVQVSFEVPEYTANSDAIGVLRLLEAIRICGLEKETKFYQASTSEMYGGVGYNMPVGGYTESSQFHPRSPYGAAKLYGYWITVNYREAYGMFACNGILFNHESPMRGETFVTRKITRAVAQYSLQKKDNIYDKLYLGNLDAKRDRGHAKDYIEGMRLMLQQSTAEDYVLATGTTVTVREFVEESFRSTGVDIVWSGVGIEEKGINKANGDVVIEIDPRYFRPSEVDVLLGDSSKARKQLGWAPRYNRKQLAQEMVEYDIKHLRQ